MQRWCDFSIKSSKCLQSLQNRTRTYIYKCFWAHLLVDLDLLTWPLNYKCNFVQLLYVHIVTLLCALWKIADNWTSIVSRLIKLICSIGRVTNWFILFVSLLRSFVYYFPLIMFKRFLFLTFRSKEYMHFTLPEVKEIYIVSLKCIPLYAWITLMWCWSKLFLFIYFSEAREMTLVPCCD